MEGLEASSDIDFQTSSGDYGPPFHLDNMGHISGFISNGSEVLDDTQVYISHGWGALKILGGHPPRTKSQKHQPRSPD
ncbi:hypothetical protein K431DRAFT_282616 [Polychaeton citri CBS 116435]|uniref:Uncharacterized protein n=1 Tax=Polychaeton citri CBS 116435 TaxID=1314669 RepID=A0A9P4QFU1_9PEZI|nr:hypothetical protein K431DRAFT_282616 [Polychaeton citri CBS 116435]